jgi:hypothetical protein
MKLFVAFLLSFFISQSFSQVPQFDKLEQLYDQQHFKVVFRKSNFLLDNPTYDYSQLPIYYKSISSLQLYRDDRWRKNHSAAFDEAIATFETINSTAKGRKLILAHQEELSALKLDLNAWLADLTRRNEKDLAYFFALKITALFNGIELSPKNDSYSWQPPSSELIAKRVSIIEFARKQLGVPYVWAGESPDGFDCSGFTSFVLASENIKVPRRAQDQYDASVKISPEKAQIGDLVFFSNGTEISHVGILINELGKPKTMIHASSSKGISIVEIDSSNYWKPRVAGYGRFVP